MNGYKAPSFQDRAAASSQAKEKALAMMKAAPRPQPTDVAVLAALRADREASAQVKAAASRQAREDRQRLADEKREKARQAQVKAEQPKRTEAELKAARDARYAARKSRK